MAAIKQHSYFEYFLIIMFTRISHMAILFISSTEVKKVLPYLVKSYFKWLRFNVESCENIDKLAKRPCLLTAFRSTSLSCDLPALYLKSRTPGSRHHRRKRRKEIRGERLKWTSRNCSPSTAGSLRPASSTRRLFAPDHIGLHLN